MIDVRNLSKTYKTYKRGSSFASTMKGLVWRKYEYIEALKDISFRIEPGELVGFIGPNGAGKSTTIKILSGILHPTSGEASIMGYTPWKDRRKYVANIGAVFGQKSQLLWDIPPADAFALNKAIYNIPDAQYKKTLKTMTELLDVSELIKRPTRQLSLGERMKCEFIMAMLHNPKIVFLDEPTIGLDVIAKEKIREFILEMNKQGSTFILTTHDLGDIERLASRVLVINNGELVFDNNLKTLKNKLGNKKIITVSSHDLIRPITDSAVTIKEKTTDYDIIYNLDTDKQDIGSFIDKLNASCKIKDLLIKEEPIEEIIKNLYNNGY